MTLRRLLVFCGSLSWEWCTHAQDGAAAHAEVLDRLPKLRGQAVRLLLLPLTTAEPVAPVFVSLCCDDAPAPFWAWLRRKIFRQPG